MAKGIKTGGGGEVLPGLQTCVKTALMTKYTVIVKVGDPVDGDRFLKYRNVRDLDRFTSFLQRKWKGWRWYNFYDPVTGDQVGNRTNRSE